MASAANSVISLCSTPADVLEKVKTTDPSPLTSQLQDILPHALHTNEVIAGEKQELMGHECACEDAKITANEKWRLKKPADKEPSSTFSGPEVTEIQSKGQSNVSVWASIGGRPVKALVASGAALSVVSEALARTGHASENRFNEAPGITSVRTASGEELHVLGGLRWNLQLVRRLICLRPMWYVG